MTTTEPTEEEVKQDWFGLLMLIGAIVALGVLASWSWAIVVVAVIFMIFMHELGHYLTARLTGMKVTEFFIGFGPRLWSFRRGETEYGVKAIPAGAYVRIIGMNNLDEVEPGDEDRAYRVKSFPRRLLVVSAGSAMHFLMAIILIFILLVAYGERTDDGRWSVAAVSDNSAAGELGIEAGDEILSVDGVQVDDFIQFGELVSARGGEEIEVTYIHDGETITDTTVLGARLTQEGADAFTGLILRDRIIQVAGHDVFSWDDVVAAVDGRFGEELAIVVDPPQGTELIVIDEAVVHELPEASVATTGFFGVGQERYRTDVGVFDAAGRSVTEFGSFSKLAVTNLWDFFAGGGVGNFVSDTFTDNTESAFEEVQTDVAVDREIAGRRLDARNPDEDRVLSIYGAIQAGTLLADESFEGLLFFLAGLNIFVGLFNLLPLPPLDGGHVMVASYERIRSFGGRRHEVDYAKLIPLTYVVFFVLVAFGLVALFRDIVDPISLG